MSPRRGTPKNGNGKAKHPKRPNGRPHALDADKPRIERLLSYLSETKSKTVAAAKAGLSWSNVSKWVEQGRHEDDGKFRDFYLAFMRAREQIIHECAEKAMNQDPKWFLANELRQEFTLKLEVEHTGGLKVDLAASIRDGLKALMQSPEVVNRLEDKALRQ